MALEGAFFFLDELIEVDKYDGQKAFEVYLSMAPVYL